MLRAASRSSRSMPRSTQLVRQFDVVPDALDVARCRRHAQETGTDVMALKMVFPDEGFEAVHRALHCAGPTDTPLHQIDDRE